MSRVCCCVLYFMFCYLCRVFLFFFFKQKTAYEMRISDWSSDVCSSDLLGGVGIEVQVQRLDEAPRERRPVHVRVGRDVGVVVAHGAVDLAAERHRGQLLALALQAGDDVGDFLADGGGRGGLAVGAREHRQCGVLVRHRAQRLRSEEHTSELQSLMRISYAGFCLKKKKTQTNSLTQQSQINTNNQEHKSNQ